MKSCSKTIISQFFNAIFSSSLKKLFKKIILPFLILFFHFLSKSHPQKKYLAVFRSDSLSKHGPRENYFATFRCDFFIRIFTSLNIDKCTSIQMHNHYHFFLSNYDTDIDCGKLPPLLYGSVYYLNNTTHLDSEVMYNCTRNYKLVGSHIRKCMANRAWSGSSTKCEGKIFIKILHLLFSSKSIP